MNKFLQFCILATALFAMTTATQAMIYEYSIDDQLAIKMEEKYIILQPVITTLTNNLVGNTPLIKK